MRDGVDRLFVIVAVVWLGYTAFMLTAYVITFIPKKQQEQRNTGVTARTFIY